MKGGQTYHCSRKLDCLSLSFGKTDYHVPVFPVDMMCGWYNEIARFIFKWDF